MNATGPGIAGTVGAPVVRKKKPAMLRRNVVKNLALKIHEKVERSELGGTRIYVNPSRTELKSLVSSATQHATGRGYQSHIRGYTNQKGHHVMWDGDKEIHDDVAHDRGDEYPSDEHRHNIFINYDKIGKRTGVEVNSGHPQVHALITKSLSKDMENA